MESKAGLKGFPDGHRNKFKLYYYIKNGKNNKQQENTF